MSAILDTKRMAERLLNTLSYDIAVENDSFTPVPTETYLRVQFAIRTPEDPVIGDRYYRERITLQVFVCAPLNEGTGEAIEVAEEVRALFFKGQTFIEDATRIYVLNTPRISGNAITTDRLVVPVIIDLVSEVYT